MEYREQLLSLAGAFCAATGRSESRVATIAANGGAFFARLRAGKACSVDTYLKVKAWFGLNWPADLAWPEGVDRPEVVPAGEPVAHDATKQPDAPERQRRVSGGVIDLDTVRQHRPAPASGMVRDMAEAADRLDATLDALRSSEVSAPRAQAPRSAPPAGSTPGRRPRGPRNFR